MNDIPREYLEYLAWIAVLVIVALIGAVVVTHIKFDSEEYEQIAERDEEEHPCSPDGHRECGDLDDQDSTKYYLLEEIEEMYYDE